MRYYYKQLYQLGLRLLLVMVFLTLTRLVFYIFNLELYSNLSFFQVILHFVYGLRFDLATVALFNLVFVLLSVLPEPLVNKKWYQQVLKILFLVVNTFVLALNMIDVKFYEFEGKRLGADFFTKEWLGNDFIALLPEFIKDYWFLFLFFALFIYVFARLYPNQKVSETKSEKRFPALKLGLQLLIGSVVLFIMIIFGRGGFQLKPIGVIAAVKYTSPEYAGLVLNSPFTVVKTWGRKVLHNPNYFDAQQLDSIFNPEIKLNHQQKFRNKNVVIIILESFGREYSGFLNNNQGYTPNLDSIMQQGLAFTNAFANGKRSIEALPSILSSLPAIMDNAFVTSLYSSNHIESLAAILKSKGYQTSFYHGGKNGTMGFDNFTKLAGIDAYFGMNEYPNEEDYDGNWGIYDEPYLQYFCNEISQMKEPFFTSVFTLSSHHPYSIPEKYTGKFPQGNLINIESIGYADYALKRFFETAEKQPWYKNTLFVLTADHTAQAEADFYKTNVGKYAVPLVFFAPGDNKLKGLSERICQQTDIFPSVLDYLRYNEPFVSFGSSVFREKPEGFAIAYSNGLYQLVYDNYAIHFNGSKVVSVDTLLYQPLNPILTPDSVIVDILKGEQLLKGIIQQFNVRMEENLMKYNSDISYSITKHE
ncbi:MAG: LTA synthase family protein [Salinivirgaceae bacterium]